MDHVNWIAALLIFASVVALLFVVVTRGTRAMLGRRRRLEEGLGLAVLEGRLRRGEISREAFDRAAAVMTSERRPGDKS
jgi:uncharacterized membrane protein